MTLKESLRQAALSKDIDYFGVGSVDRWANAPKDHRPTDILPGAKSVIVVGMRIPEGCVEANKRAYEGMRHGVFVYMCFGYNLVNDLLEDACFRISKPLEQHGHRVFLPPASVGRDEEKMMGILSNRHSAVCAGLAEFGLNGLALTPDAGPRVRWAAVITDAPLQADPLYSGPPICTGCKNCITICPTGAFSAGEVFDIPIGERVFHYAKLNRPVCRAGVTGLAKGTAGRLQEPGVKEKIHDVTDWLKLVKSDDKWNRLERVAAMCGRCMIECQAGKPLAERANAAQANTANNTPAIIL